MTKSIYFFFLISFFHLNSFGQSVIMGEAGFPQSNPIDCASFGTGNVNFFDPGNAGNYTANYNDTTVFCPQLSTGTKVSITFATNAGYEFDVDGSDFISVFDGPTASAPLLGTHNSDTDPSGFAYQATWNNPSGCLTVVFITDGFVEGSGWAASVQCGNAFQPFEQHIEAFINGVGPNALNPLDTGYVDVCFGDSILFVSKPIFPNSLEATGSGYSQNSSSNINFQWTITDGNLYPSNDSIWFTPPTRNGFLVDSKVTDAFPQSARMRCKVRVSQIPSFAGTGSEEDTVCLGLNTVLLGGVTFQDTVGIDIPDGTFELGGSFAGLTYLPDGSGQNYQAPISISGFPEDATIQDAQSLNQVCITMEHSFLGDLEIWLRCPNGTDIPLVNSYSPGAIPGGNSGGGTFLGHPIDNSGGSPGIGWEYCFSSVFNTTGTMMGTYPGNTIPVPNSPPLTGGTSIDPSDTYSPETTFASFAGCPVNGTWTIFVRDNLGVDDGYIFEWGLYFDESYFPGLGGYSNIVDTTWWSFDPTIVSGLNGDTLILVQPDVPGTYSYQMNIIDDFGCLYDTTVSISFLDQPIIFPDTVTCNSTFQVSGTVSFDGGIWTSTDPEISFSNANLDNPLITISNPGSYSVLYTDSQCNSSISSDIVYLPDINVDIPDATVCAGENYLIIPTYTSTGSLDLANYLISWNNGSTDTTIFANDAGTYILTVTNACYTDRDTLIVYDQPSIFSDTIACNLTHQVVGTYAPNGGIWSTTSQNITISDPTISNPVINASMAGVYSVRFKDTVCQTQINSTIEFPPKMSISLIDSLICIGTNLSLVPIYYNIPPIQSTYNSPINLVWEDGSTNPLRQIYNQGIYTATISNECYVNSANSTITYKPCEIEIPNIINLSSNVGNNLFFVQHVGLESFNCMIFNRYGNLIYEYSDPDATWDGKTADGKPVVEGTYFYKIVGRFDGLDEDFIKHGFIVVKY